MSLVVLQRVFSGSVISRYRLPISLFLSVVSHLLLFAVFAMAVGHSFQPIHRQQDMLVTLQTSPAEQELIEPVEEPASFVASEQSPDMPEPIETDVSEVVGSSPSQQMVAEARTEIEPVREAKSETPKQDVVPVPEIAFAEVNTIVPEKMQGLLLRPEVIVAESSYQVAIVDDLDKPTQTHKLSASEYSMLQDKVKSLSIDAASFSDQQGSVEWLHDGQAYAATVKNVPAQSEIGLDRVVIQVETQQGDKTLTTELQLKRMAFSNYSHFINRWEVARGFGDLVAFNDDVIEGRFHSNAEILVGYSEKTKPRFLGQVTTSASRVAILKDRSKVKLSKKKSKEIFLGGIETGVDKIDLPDKFAPFPYDATPHPSRIHRLITMTGLEFFSDGRVLVKQENNPVKNIFLGDEPHYFLSSGKTTVSVKGILKGQALVYSPYQILVVGNLTYADKEGILSSDSYLGLVSDRNVSVAGPKVTGNGDLVIHAAIYAKQKFNVQNYRVRSNAKLTVVGSVTSGLPAATEPRFRTVLKFDKRLEKFRPPGYPLTDRYELDSWNEIWEVVENE